MIAWFRSHPHLSALLFLSLLPMALLWPSLLGNNTYVPWDLAQFPPVATKLTPAEHQQTIHEHNTDVTEIPVMFGPQLEFIRSELHQGRVVHWDPYSRSGTPIWASSILGIAYPLHWPLFLGLDPYQGFALSAYLAFLIGSMLMYGFLVRLGLGVLPALFGAIAFAYSATLMINSHFYQRVDALIWLPGILWAIQSMVERRKRERVPPLLCLALCMFLTMTAGFPPYALVVAFVAAAFACWHLVRQWRRAGPRPTLVLAGMVGAGAVLGVVAATVQLLPMTEFFPVSNRDIQATGNGIARGGFNWYGLLGYLMPDLFSHPHVNVTGNLPDRFSPLTWYLQTGTRWELEVGSARTLAPGTHFEPNYNNCEYAVFLGVVGLFLATAGALHPRPGFRGFAIGTLVALILLASAGWWVSWLLSMPPLCWVPPLRFVGPNCMFLAALAALGVGALPNLRRAAVVTLVTGGLVGAGICFGYWAWVNAHNETEILQAMLPTLQEKYSPAYGKFPLEEAAKYLGPSMPMARQHMLSNLAYAGWLLLGCALALVSLRWVCRLRHGVVGLQLLALIVLLAELLAFGAPLNRGRELKHSHHTDIHDFLVQERDRHQATGGFTVMRASPGSEPIIPKQLPGGTLLNYRIRDLNSYTFVDRHSHKPLLALYGHRYMSRLYWPKALPDDDRLDRPYFDLLGVRFVLAEMPLQHAGRKVGPKFQGPLGEFWIYERDTALPAAFVVHDFREIGGGEEAIVDALISKEFAPTSYCLLDSTTVRELTRDRSGNLPRQAIEGNNRRVTFASNEDPDQVKLHIAPGEPGYLVLNQTCMPGWSAIVNGVPAKTYPTNLFLSMIPVGPEASRVELSYITPGFRTGLWLTLSSFAVMALLALLYLRSRRRAPGVEIPL